MFQTRIFGGNPTSFKLILEYGKDSSAEQAAILPGSQVRLTKALATLEFEFSSDESEANVLERFTQAKSKIAFDRLEQRVVLKLSQQDKSHQGISVKLSVACMSPTLRSVQVVRSSSTGSAPEALLTALFKHCDLTGVWKLRGAEGFGNFWCSCCEVRNWRSLANLNLASCGLTSLPPALSSLVTLRILRLSHNRLTALPSEVAALTALEVLAADHNQLTSVPALRCSSLRHLELEDNRLARLVLDLRALPNLVSLQLYGNPIEYLPELSPATALRSLSLANVRIMADAAYSRWEVEVAPVPYISRSHKLTSLFKMTFRSSCQHPLLAGALGRISEDRANCELMDREQTAVQQLVLMALSEQPVVAEQACRTLGALAQLGLATARKVLAHDVVSTILTLLRSQRRASKLCGLSLLGSLAAASEAVSAELMAPEQMLPLVQSCVQADDREVRVAALTALASLAFCRENKRTIRSAPGLLPTLIELAEAPSAGAAAAAVTTLASRNSPTAAASARGSANPVQQQQKQQQNQLLPDGSTTAPLSQGMDPLSPVRQQTSEAGPAAAAPPLPLPLMTPLPSSTAIAAPTVELMPPRSMIAAGIGIGGSGGGVHQRHSDTGGGGGGGGGTQASFWVGSPPETSGSYMLFAGYGQGPASWHQSAPGSTSVLGGGGGARATGGPVSPYRGSQGQLGPASPVDAVASPRHQQQQQQQQQQQTRSMHHSASTPAAIGMAAAAAAASSRAISPVQTTGHNSSGPLSPTSPTAGEVSGGAATAASGQNCLPPQIALGPPRAVPEPVARHDQVRLLAIKVLAILGENEHVRRALGQPPIAGRGVRVLALDGGGMRGLALVQIMRHIERKTGKPLHQLFDLVVGTSTGAIVAFGLGVFHFTLDQCEAIYTGLGHRVFNQASSSPRDELLAAANAAAAASAATTTTTTTTTSSSTTSTSTTSSSTTVTATGWRDSLLFRMMRGTSTNLRVAVYGFKHDASTFEDLLRQMCDAKKLGCVSNQLIDAAALGSPKVAAVATLVSSCPVTPFLFTSYELPPEMTAAAAAMRACPSSSRHLLWQAVRASSAAPYYLDDFVCGDERYQDGAATANNPSILAIQQARLLWPGVQLEALVSLGCGAAPPVRRERGAHAVLDTGAVLVDAATSPDRADEALSTLLPLVPGARYFRFQPIHETCAMELDDVNPQHWGALQAAVDEYCTAHSTRIDELAELLLSGRGEGGGGAGAPGSQLVAGGGRGSGGGEEEEEEAPFEVPAGVGSDGGPLPRVPRVRLCGQREVVIVEAPRAAGLPQALNPHPHHLPATTTASGADGGDVYHRLLLTTEQLVVEALAQRPHTLRRDLSVIAADAAMSAALVEAHMRRLEAQEQQQQQEREQELEQEPRRQEHGHGHGQQQTAATQRAARAHSTGSSSYHSLLSTPITAADEVAGAEADGTVVSDLHRPPSGTAASAGFGAASVTATGLVSPPYTSTAVVRGRVPSTGGRHWISGSSGRGLASSTRLTAPLAMATAGDVISDGGGGPMEVAGDVVVAEAAAAAAAEAEGGVLQAVTVPEPQQQPVAAGPTAGAAVMSTGTSSVADAAMEAAEAASAGGTSGIGGWYDYLFPGKRIHSARGMSTGGGGGTVRTGAADAHVATCAKAEAAVSSSPASGATTEAIPNPSLPPPSSSSSGSSANAASVDFAPPPPPPPSTSGTPMTGHSLKNPSTTLTVTATKSAGSVTMMATEAVLPAASPPTDGDTAAAAAGLHEVKPAVLLAALLQDLQGRCGLLHLGLRPVYGTSSAGYCGAVHPLQDGDCGLVASWAEEVVAVVEPGPDADRILSELGYDDDGSGNTGSGNRSGGGSGGGHRHRSLASLFAANNGAALESSRCCTYRLLARQELWYNGTPLATLLLQVTRPAMLLQPKDFPAMAPQLSGLVVTAAAPLPPAITTALLRAGAAAVICPNARILPAAASSRLQPSQDPSTQSAATALPQPPGGGARAFAAASDHLNAAVATAPPATAEMQGGGCMVLPYSAGGRGGVQRAGREHVMSSSPPPPPSQHDQHHPQQQQRERQTLQRSSGGGGGGVGDGIIDGDQQRLLSVVAVKHGVAEACAGVDGTVNSAVNADADAVVGYFEALVSNLVEGSTVLGAMTAADRQQTAMRGRIAFHHL